MSAPTATADVPFDPGEFLLCGVPYLLADRAAVRADGSVPLSEVATLRAANPRPGSIAEYVPMFTDADLAGRFLTARGNRGAELVAIRPASVGAFAVLVAELAKRRAWVGFDPAFGATRHTLRPAAAVLAAVVEAANANGSAGA